MNPCKQDSQCQQMQQQIKLSVQAQSGGSQSSSMRVVRKFKIKPSQRRLYQAYKRSGYQVKWTGNANTGFVYVAGQKLTPYYNKVSEGNCNDMNC